MKNYKYLGAIILIISLISCSEDDQPQKLTLPSNLKINVEADVEKPGLVTVSSSSDNANYYTIHFGDAESAFNRSDDGKAEHTYTSSGTYSIRVRAHATDAEFVETSNDIAVKLEDEDDGLIPTTGYTTPDGYDGMTLVWQDEFQGESLNLDDWTFEIGTSGGTGWGNNELQYYREENTTLQDGYLIITAKEEAFEGSNYTSSRIITKDKQSFQYGRIDIRAALPQGQGIWPALWMLGANIDTEPWPASGEIDIMEMVGGNEEGKGDNITHGTAHWADASGQRAMYGNSTTLEDGIFADEFHVFSIVWDENKITWYVDDVQFNEIDTTPADLSEFHQEFFLIFNVAVGGDWPGSPDESTSFPQHLIVDYIRVFQAE